ncbi:MAG: hypothetical protein ACK52V_13440 [Betaproteobacteria bacterium]|nr:hypothetical protein [Betaproteobacteria bacterium]
MRRGAAFLQSIGLPAIESRVRHLTTLLIERLEAAGLEVNTARPWAGRAQIVSVAVADAGSLMDRLRERHHVIANVKDGALRLSLGFAGSEDDIGRAVAAIREESGR